MDFRKEHPENFRKSKLLHRRAGNIDIEMGNHLGMVVGIAILLAIGVYVGVTTGLIKGSTAGGGSGGGTPNPATGCVGSYSAPSGFTCTQLKVAYVTSAAFAGGPVASATVIAYDPVSSAPIESPSATDSTGTTTSSNPYYSGTTWNCKLSASGYVTSYLPCTVPANPSGNTALTTITLPLPMVSLQTYQVTASVQGGSNWSSSFSAYSFANSGTTSVGVTWQISGINNNKGYVSGFDPLRKVANLAVLELKSPSSPTTTATGCQFSATINNVATCQFILPDGITTINGNYAVGSNPVIAYFPKTTVGTYSTAFQPSIQTVSVSNSACVGSMSQEYAGTTTYPIGNGGQVNCGMTFNLGGLASGSSETWTQKIFIYADPAFYDGAGGTAQNANYGGDQASQTESPSWTNIVLRN